MTGARRKTASGTLGSWSAYMARGGLGGAAQAARGHREVQWPIGDRWRDVGTAQARRSMRALDLGARLMARRARDRGGHLPTLEGDL